MDTNRLRGEIAARYKTQSAFADAINWNKNKVTNLLKGTYKPSIDDVVKIASLLNLSEQVCYEIFLQY